MVIRAVFGLVFAQLTRLHNRRRNPGRASFTRLAPRLSRHHLANITPTRKLRAHLLQVVQLALWIRKRDPPLLRQPRKIGRTHVQQVRELLLIE